MGGTNYFSHTFRGRLHFLFRSHGPKNVAMNLYGGWEVNGSVKFTVQCA